MPATGILCSPCRVRRSSGIGRPEPQRRNLLVTCGVYPLSRLIGNDTWPNEHVHVRELLAIARAALVRLVVARLSAAANEAMQPARSCGTNNGSPLFMRIANGGRRGML